jgi:FkbM family methyltransferase
VPSGTERTQRQIEKILAVFGRSRSRWLLWRERWGDRSLVSIKYAGHRQYLRLNTTDPLVWFSVFHQEDYGAQLPFEPKVIIDAGAYIGLSAIYFANRYPLSRIIAIEPDYSNFQLLRKNCRRYPMVTPVCAALWFEDAELILYPQPEGHWAFSLVRGETDTSNTVNGRIVRAICIETLMATFDLDTVDLLKLDVEGAEKEILMHSQPWIDRIRAIFIELHDRLRPGCTEALGVATRGFEHVPVSPMTTLLIRSP